MPILGMVETPILYLQCYQEITENIDNPYRGIKGKYHHVGLIFF